MPNDRPVLDGQTPLVSPGNYSPVTVNISDSLGAFFLGILTIILLIGWRRAETRLHRLMMQQEITNKNPLPEIE